VSIDPEDLRKHYVSLSDDQLLELDREDLTSAAQRILDFEIRRRGLNEDVADDEPETDPTFSSSFPSTNEDFEEVDWAENAFPVTTFSRTGPEEAGDARNALLDAGIPCEVIEEEIDPSDEPVGSPYKEYRVMVPNALSLQAASVLDTAIFNGRLEADWKTQIESLSDEELSALDVDALCAGLLDRVERLRKLHKRELARRSE
jgi:hypothetical protein